MIPSAYTDYINPACIGQVVGYRVLHYQFSCQQTDLSNQPILKKKMEFNVFQL